MPTLQGSAAILPARNLVAALKHYEQLGFQTRSYKDTDDHPIYGFLTWGSVEMHVAAVGEFDIKTNTTAVYLRVDDPDALYEAWSRSGVGGTLAAPEDKPWGMREMIHIDLDGNLLRIGRTLR